MSLGDGYSGRSKEQKIVLLVLSERVRHKELIFKIQSKSQAAATNALGKHERKLEAGFTKTFKTIAFDNGYDNLDFESFKRTAKNGCRTKWYYAHPYSVLELNTNRNINKMIRRFISKGADFSKCTNNEIKRIEHWINNYPNKILKGLSANMFEEVYSEA